MRLSRYHGLGNDYLVYERGPTLKPDLVRAICDRHRGVGSDGILEPADAGGSDCGVRIWNPDGSVAEKSGNGLRIFAQWMVDTDRQRGVFSIWTGFDAVIAEVRAADVRVEMGTARFKPADVPFRGDGPWLPHALSLGDEVVSVNAVGLGNPHAVVFVDDDLDAVPWRRWGEALEVHPAFPNRINVQVARVRSDNLLEARIWERGAGPTLASGSSSCAVAAAAVARELVSPGRKVVRMEGGEVTVSVSPSFALELIGAVERVGAIEVDPRWLAVRRS